MQKSLNLYQASREHACLTQETAAELLGICVESLRAYELGKRRPSDDMVLRMQYAYHDRWLGYYHLKASPLAATLPDLQQRSLQETAMRIFRLVQRFVRNGRTEQLLEIAEDGVIDDSEKPLFHEIMAELREIIAELLAIEIEKAPNSGRTLSGASENNLCTGYRV